MKKVLIHILPQRFPSPLHDFLADAAVYDSSCSQEASVWYIEKGEGFYLKRGKAGALEQEAAMARYFHSKGLGAEVLSYLQGDQDWLLTKELLGEDCLFSTYLDDPIKLCDSLAMYLRQLHETDASDCPVRARENYLAIVRKNHDLKNYDHTLFPDNWGYRSPEEAWQVVLENIPYFTSDTLVHGDYCLPNIILKDWKLSGFIDLGLAGLSDRHIDLHWGIWSLGFNLKTDRYRERFLDVYGRDQVEPELLRAISAFEVFR